MARPGGRREAARGRPGNRRDGLDVEAAHGRCQFRPDRTPGWEDERTASMTSTIDAPLNASSPARSLGCRGCGAQFPLAAQHACFECFGPLEVGYDPAALRRATRERIAAGPKNIWRYADLLPAGQDPASRVTLNPGLTPLVPADALAREFGIQAPLWVKDDSANPTHPFKDRVGSVAPTPAPGLGLP